MSKHNYTPRLRFMTLRLDESEYAALASAAADAGCTKGEILRAGMHLWLASAAKNATSGS